ncbi:mucin-1 [Carlito syrichta]|uniref:Mucin-1 n=1 Tax=Carlito syrichta TaxID=1868482 RepID=A0A1U7SK93_CARSF|nr:mucin-1 [Carlito syrichta]
MTPGIQSPFFLLLLRLVLSGEGRKSPGPNSGTTHKPAHGGTAGADDARHSGATTPAPAHGSTTRADDIHHSGTIPTAAHGASATTTADTGPGSGVTPTPAHNVTTTPATRPDSGATTTPVHNVTLVPTRSTSSTLVHDGTSAKAPTTPGTKSPPSSVPSHPSAMPPTPASHGPSTVTRNTRHSTAPSPTSSQDTSSQMSIRVSFFFLSFHIVNLQFNSSLENPSTKYYQELQRNISELFLQIYKQEDFLGLSSIKFRPGSVVAESTLAFREGATNAQDVKTQFAQHEKEAANYNLHISGVSAREVPFPSSSQSGSGVPGWGIALLVLVCVLVALAIIYFIALAVCQCCRKNYGHLDIFPTRDAYHPMSEYPTYHTHGRYAPPGSTGRSPYEEVTAGNGGSSISYTNPAAAATSANL